MSPRQFTTLLIAAALTGGLIGGELLPRLQPWLDALATDPRTPFALIGAGIAAILVMIFATPHIKGRAVHLKSWNPQRRCCRSRIGGPHISGCIGPDPDPITPPSSDQ